MEDLKFHIFDTPIGKMGIIWSGLGITGLALPHGTSKELRKFIGDKFLTAAQAIPDRRVTNCCRQIVKFLNAKRYSFADIDIDLSGRTDFERIVYETLFETNPGSQMTYGELASVCGYPKCARAVGRAMATNRVPIIIPCHRVVPASGGVGHYSGNGGSDLKRKLLEIEAGISAPVANR